MIAGRFKLPMQNVCLECRMQSLDFVYFELCSSFIQHIESFSRGTLLIVISRLKSTSNSNQVLMHPLPSTGGGGSPLNMD